MLNDLEKINSAVNNSREVVLMVTITNWDEPPRIRHEMAYQLSRFYNVVYFQIYSQRGFKRRECDVNENLKIRKIGYSFVGLTKLLYWFPIVRRLYNNYLSYRIQQKIMKYFGTDLTLFSFQFDFPEIFETNKFKRKIYFCNDDFISQYSGIGKKKRKSLQDLQRRVLKNADAVFSVSAPLSEILIENGAKNMSVIESGHSFDPVLSREYIVKQKKTFINLCYLGFLSDSIEVDWFLKILKNERIILTVIGPIGSKTIKRSLEAFKNFKHIGALTGKKLQEELLENHVLLMPYRSAIDNELTTVPAKLFQYLATGKPIVSSLMPNLIKMPEKFVYPAKNYITFSNLIMQAYNEDTLELRNSRIDFAMENTWDKRGDVLYEIIRDL